MIKIFHTADLHLDSAHNRLGHAERVRAREGQREVFRSMIKYVSENSFDMMLIAGDLFDTHNIKPETEKCIIEGFASLDCPVVISPGNHDPYGMISLYSDGRLPQNVTVFNSEEMQVLEFDGLGVQICGYAFMSDRYAGSPLSGFERPDFAGASILCAHTELNAPMSSYAPILRSDIERCRFTYAALGHIHTMQDIVKTACGAAAYCGFPEGRGFDELGRGGAIALTLEGGRISDISRIPFGERQYLCESLDIGEIDGNRELVLLLEKYLEERGYGKNIALRLTLVGETDPELRADTRAAEALLADRLMYAEVLDRSAPRIDTSRLESDRTLRGEVYRVLGASLESADATERRLAAEALRAAMAAIEGGEIV